MSPTKVAAIALSLLFVSIVSFKLYSKRSMSATASSSATVWRLNQGLVCSGNAVSLPKAPTSSSKFSAMYLGQGSHLQTNKFTIRIDSGSQVCIGWVLPGKFGEGWATKGLFFGGNLADGGALLRSDFGPWPKQGDVVSTAVNVEANVLRVTFSVNGVELGTAFEIDQANTIGDLFPMVAFTDTAATVSVVADDVVMPTRKPTSRLEGKWESVATTKPVTLTIEEHKSNEFRLAFKAGNVIRTTVRKNGDVDGKWERIGHASSTMMLPPPEYRELEHRINTLLADFDSIREVEGEPFFLEFKSTKGDLFYFQPVTSAQVPVNRSELDRALKL